MRIAKRDRIGFRCVITTIGWYACMQQQEIQVVVISKISNLLLFSIRF